MKRKQEPLQSILAELNKGSTLVLRGAEHNGAPNSHRASLAIDGGRNHLEATGRTPQEALMTLELRVRGFQLRGAV